MRSPEKRNPGARDAGTAHEVSHPHNTPSPVSRATAAALACLDAAGDPGHATPGELAEGLASIWRARLDRPERLLLAGAGLLALDSEDRAAMTDAASEAEPYAQAIARRWRAMLARYDAERGGVQ